MCEEWQEIGQKTNMRPIKKLRCLIILITQF